jgi:hypothetical protein
MFCTPGRVQFKGHRKVIQNATPCNDRNAQRHRDDVISVPLCLCVSLLF